MSADAKISSERATCRSPRWIWRSLFAEILAPPNLKELLTPSRLQA